MTRRKNRDIDCNINSFNKKGNGVGSIINNEALSGDVEVPFAVPGDVVHARILKKRKGKYLSLLEEVQVPSKMRIVPRCLHFGECGGCRWQQLSYPDQLEQKNSFVKRCFETLITSDVEVRPIIPCKAEWQYRNKMEFSFSSDISGNLYLGLVKDSSQGRVLNITECHLVAPWFTETLEAVRGWWRESGLDAYKMHKNSGSLRTLTVREGKRTGDRMVMLTVSGNPDYALHKHQLEKFVAVLRNSIEPKDPQSKLSVFLRIQQVGKGMPTNYYEMVLYGPNHIREILEVQVDPSEPAKKLEFHVSPTAFFQPNTEQAEVLYSTALQMAGIPKNSVVYDLYCGTGTLGICAAGRAEKVIGIEMCPESALDARMNATKNGIDNFTILSGAVGHVLEQIYGDKNYPLPDIVVIDPPRPGLDAKELKSLLSLNAKKILYVSCNPETCALNVAELIENGYRLRSLQPVDQFAQTPHVEMVALLERTQK